MWLDKAGWPRIRTLIVSETNCLFVLWLVIYRKLALVGSAGFRLALGSGLLSAFALMGLAGKLRTRPLRWRIEA